MIKYLLLDFNNVLLFRSVSDEKSPSDFEEVATNVPFFSSAYINTALLSYCQSLSERGIKVGVLTAGFSFSIPAIKKRVEDHFEDIFITKQLGLPKDLPATYVQVSERIELTPEEILFIDDIESNIEAAAQAGCNTILFESNKSLFRKLNTYFPTE